MWGSKTGIVIAVMVTLMAGLSPAHAGGSDIDVEKTKASHSLIGVEEAHRAGFDGKGQTIVIIDTGVQTDHPYFKSALIDGYCSSSFICPNDTNKSGIQFGAVRVEPGRTSLDSHGSMVAGIAVGRAFENVPNGVAPAASVISINNTGGNDPGIERALRWVLSVKDKYKIAAVSASFGISGVGSRGTESACRANSLIDPLIKQLHDAGIAFVAATGNSGAFSNVDFPACSPYAIAVGAVDSRGAITSYSDIGKSTTVLAPADVIGGEPGNRFFIGAGTSSATPIVAGTIALLKQAKPTATVPEIRAALATSQTYLTDVIWKNIPLLHIPTALDAIKTGKFAARPVMETEVGDLVSMQSKTQLALTAALEAQAQLKKTVDALSSQVAALQVATKKQQLKLSKICGVKPKPKGC